MGPSLSENHFAEVFVGRDENSAGIERQPQYLDITQPR
jgi:hypothetical protein